MTQVSKYKLSREAESEMFETFFGCFRLFSSKKHMDSFLSEFLTDTEKVMLAKRFTIAVLLLRGKRPVDIKHVLHVTNSAIGPVVRWLQYASTDTKALFDMILEKKQWQAFMDNIDGLIDQIPPRYGTDWSKAGKEKEIRRRGRSARELLRSKVT